MPVYWCIICFCFVTDVGFKALRDFREEIMQNNNNVADFVVNKGVDFSFPSIH